MTAWSSVPRACAALLAAITTQVAADPLASQVLVCIGEPPMDSPNDIIQVVTNVRRVVRPEAMMGSYNVSGPLEENYEIQCLVSSWSGSSDPVSILNRAYVLASYVESAVRVDPSLGSTVLEAHPSGTDGGEPKWTSEPIGRLCELTVTIEARNLN